MLDLRAAKGHVRPAPGTTARNPPTAMRSYLDFEKPVAELEAKIEELRAVLADGAGEVQVDEEISRLESKAAAYPQRPLRGSDPVAEDPGARGIRSGRIALDFIGATDRRISSRSRATASSATTMRSSAASAASAARASA